MSAAMEESKESAEEEQLFDTIKETMPPGHHICKTIPTLDASLVGRCIAFRWNLGWEQGCVTKFHSTDPQAARRKKRKVDILEANFEVEFISDAYLVMCCSRQHTSLRMLAPLARNPAGRVLNQSCR